MNDNPFSLATKIRFLVHRFLQMTALERPSPLAIYGALCTLRAIKALSPDEGREELTPLGLHLSRLPMNPQLGRMIIYAVLFRCLDPVLTVAAALSHKDPFYMPVSAEREAREAKRRLARGTREGRTGLEGALHYSWRSYTDEENQSQSHKRQTLAECLTTDLLV